MRYPTHRRPRSRHSEHSPGGALDALAGAVGVFLSSPRFSVRAYSYRFISKPGFIGGSVHRSSCLSFLTARLGPPVHGASALRPRHRHRRAVRWRSDDPPPPPRPCRRPRTARRAMLFTGAPGRSCKLLLHARCSLGGGNKSSSGSRARGPNGAAGIISSTITARPTRPVRCYNTYTAAAPCPHPARSQVTTWTQGGRPPPRQPTSPTCGAPLHRRRTAKFAAGRAAVSA